MGKVIRRTPEQRKEILRELNELEKTGINRTDACKKVGISLATFYMWRSANKTPARKRKGLATALIAQGASPNQFDADAVILPPLSGNKKPPVLIAFGSAEDIQGTIAAISRFFTGEF